MFLYLLFGISLACEPATLAQGSAPVDRLHAEVIAAFNASDGDAMFETIHDVHLVSAHGLHY